MCRVLVLLLLFGCTQEVVDDGIGEGMVGQKEGTYEAFVKGRPVVAVRGRERLLGSASPIPQENRIETPRPPVPGNATEDAGRHFLEGLARGRPKESMAFVVPKALFVRLREMHMGEPERARRAALHMANQLRARLFARLSRLSSRPRYRDATFESIALGKCTWVPRHKEWNRYPYWKCQQNTLYYHVEGERRALRIKTLINWGRRWYITGL